MRLAASTIATLFGGVRDGRSASAIRYEPAQKLTCLEIEQPHEEVVPLRVDTTTDPAKRECSNDAASTFAQPPVDGAEAGELFK